MSIGYAIRALALADSGISTLLATRWYPAPLPENPVYPSVTYQIISENNVSSHQGNSNLAETRLQLNVWGTSYDNARTIKDNLKRVLRDYKGTVNSDRIDRIIWANELTANDPLTQKQQRIIDLIIWHNTTY